MAGFFGSTTFGGGTLDQDILLRIVDQCNDALSQIGQPPITGLDDATTNAGYCANMYIPLRNAELRNHIWNFALTRVALVQTSNPPSYQYKYSYTLPDDWLRITRVGMDDSTLWRIEKGLLLTNLNNASQPLYIQYIQVVDDPAEFDPLFYQMLSKRMASRLAIAILKDPKIEERLYAEYKSMFYDAAAVDSQEGLQEKIDVPDLTVDVRNDW